MVKILERIPKSAQGNIKEYIDGIKKMSEGKMTVDEADKFFREVGKLEKKIQNNGIVHYFEQGTTKKPVAEIHPKDLHSENTHSHLNNTNATSKDPKRLDGNLTAVESKSPDSHFDLRD